MPCNFGLRELAAPLKEGIRTAGANPMEFNTIAISDGITINIEGTKPSLQSRTLGEEPDHGRTAVIRYEGPRGGLGCARGSQTAVP